MCSDAHAWLLCLAPAHRCLHQVARCCIGRTTIFPTRCSAHASATTPAIFYGALCCSIHACLPPASQTRPCSRCAGVPWFVEKACQRDQRHVQAGKLLPHKVSANEIITSLSSEKTSQWQERLHVDAALLFMLPRLCKPVQSLCKACAATQPTQPPQPASWGHSQHRGSPSAAWVQVVLC